MEINPPFRVNPIGSSRDKSFEQSKTDSLSNELKEILAQLKESIENLSEWIKRIKSGGSLSEKVLAEMVEITNAFYEAWDHLERYIEQPQAQDDLHYALEIRAEVDDVLIGIIKKNTLCAYWKLLEFSFLQLMEKANYTPLIDLKRMVIHLFDEISSDNWEKVIRALDELAKKIVSS